MSMVVIHGALSAPQMIESDSAAFAIVENPILNNPVWVNVSPASPVSYDLSSSSLTGGVFRTQMFNARGSTSTKVGTNELRGSSGTIFTVVGKGIAGNSAGHAAINWREVL